MGRNRIHALVSPSVVPCPLFEGFFIWFSMRRHLIAYLIVLLIYFIPPIISSPSGWLYFVSISAWSWISAVIYLKFIMLRCATILALIEALITSCAMIAAIEFYVFKRYWYFYTNLESIIDILIVIELIVITISMMGTMIGLLGRRGYNKNLPADNNAGVGSNRHPENSHKGHLCKST